MADPSGGIQIQHRSLCKWGNPCAAVVCGGASIAQQLMRDGLIDRFYISVIPVLLGAGIRLFDELPEKQELRLMEKRNYNGIVELRYEKR